MNTAINRTQVALLTNKSGGAVAQGDVIIIDSSTAAAFTTTTTGGFIDGLIGVVMEPNGIANDAQGMVAFGGYVPKINLSGSASLGDTFKTHTVAGQAVRHNPPLVSGDFGIVLATGTTPAAWLFDSVNQGGSVGDTNLGWVLLATELKGSDGTFTFSSIAQTYQALKLHLRLRSDVASVTDGVRIQVGNSSLDTGSNYAHMVHREGLAAANSQSAAAAFVEGLIVPGNTGAANYFGIVDITIEDYAVSTYWRNMLLYGGSTEPSGYRIGTGVGTWKNAAAAIDILKVYPGAGTNWKAGSAAWLYGLKTS
jgi:hypothetical protein